MTKKHLLRGWVQFTIYFTLSIGIIWQTYNIIHLFSKPHAFKNIDSYQVQVNGNVRRPGLYRITEGTTQFEILKVAGIRPTSDISMFNLFNQVSNDTNVQVGTRSDSVKINQKPLDANLEFFFGDISIIASDGRSQPQHGGYTFTPGDRVITEEASQVEVSIGEFSRIDIDNFSELVFDKIGAVENDRKTVELFQKSGGIWYKVVYGKNDEQYKILTQKASLSVGTSGADFFVDIQRDQIVVEVMDGLVLIEKSDGSEAINLIAGQSVTIYNDGRPFLVTKLAQEISTNERFSQLSKEKINYMSKFMPLNILVCGTPAVFYLVNVNYEKSEVNVVQIPPELLIEQFAQDIESLGQAYLYGGPVFVSTFVERILNIRIHKHIVIDKNQMIKISNSIGGVNVNIDEKSASALNVLKGKQKLNGKDLMIYLSPGVNGLEISRLHQATILKNIFDDLRSKTFVPTLLLAEQLINNTETNFTPNDIMDNYNKFSSKGNWAYREHTLPISIGRRGETVVYEPDIAKCKVLFNKSE